SAEVASQFGDITVIAPSENRSAISHAITIHHALRVKEIKPNWYAVTGTPSDCTYIGMHHILDQHPDLLLSGINHGANLGIDVLYSGTVAGAMEGAQHGIPALAFSLAEYTPTAEDWVHAKRAVEDILRWFLTHSPLPKGKMLNVNIPKAPLPSPTPFTMTRLGTVQYPPQVDKRLDPNGKPYYWIGGLPPVYGSQANSDSAVIQQKDKVSITPLQLDLTDHDMLASWDDSST
ncbi:MAG TPA: 5'/3'-nucleotidase SurE, partial [Myxococcales bacterium]|nr:5'/3'-nucleotidase SurE [Myxococcales bacterium]